jgi:uncharacterized protein DUF4157/L,D-transpeptidase-like protein
MSGTATERLRAPFAAPADGVPVAARSRGEPLPSETKSAMESLFNKDFSAVRVHTDDAAARSASAMSAAAYTLGQHMYFGGGRFDPQGAKGRRLVAHELTHTLQAGRVERDRGALRFAASDGAAEREAHAAGRNAERHSAVPGVTVRGEPATVYRATEAEADEETEAPEVTDADDADVEQASLDPSDAHDGDDPVSASTQAAAEQGSAGAPEPLTSSPATPATSATPAQTAAPRTITQIDVNLSSQTLVLVWSDGKRDPAHRISSGRGMPNTATDPCAAQTEERCTPVGDFTVGRLGNASTKNSKGDAMSWYVGFVDSRGIGIHDSQPVPGIPHSHGCVRVGNSPADDQFAKLINQHVVSGTTIVHVTGKAKTKPYSEKARPRKKKSTKPRGKKP